MTQGEEHSDAAAAATVPTAPRRTRGPTRPEIRFADLVTSVTRLPRVQQQALLESLGGPEGAAVLRAEARTGRAELREYVARREAEFSAMETRAGLVAEADRLPQHLRNALIHAIDELLEPDVEEPSASTEPTPERPVRFCDQWTLGRLLEGLARCRDDAPVRFDTGREVGSAASYRGYYEDLALSDQDPEIAPRTVAVLRTALTDCIGHSYEGYKGGAHQASRETRLWVARFGDVTDRWICGLRVLDDGVVEILTALEAE
jgi:hypothetical protein